MLAHIIQAGVAPNHGTRLMFGLIHHLAVIGAVELRHGDKRGPQGVRRVRTTQILLRDQVNVFGGQAPGGKLLVFAQRDEDTALGAADDSQLGL